MMALPIRLFGHMGRYNASARRGAAATFVCAAAYSFSALAAAPEQLAGLADLTLEQLSNIEITSVSRQEEPLSSAPASIFVITADDIRRSGARTLPEALRLAPNLQVAGTSSTSYAISARGFNNSIGNKLLVLVDGRTVYTPLFSGVFWDQQEVMLEDVERIEVISGPGGTLWGANAVNGVINVITLPASDTQGTLVTAGAGNSGTRAAMRYGTALGAGGAIRVYGQRAEPQNTRTARGVSIADGWLRSSIGFRSDFKQANAHFTAQGDAYSNKSEDRPVAGPIEASGMNLLVRWTQRYDAGSDFRLQAYFDRAERKDRAGFQGDVDTFDIEAQRSMTFGSHRLLLGGGYRHARDQVDATVLPVSIQFVPASRTLQWQSVFVQDEVQLTKELEFTAGVKFERNDYTGWESLPSARLAWNMTPKRLLWSAISRAVRAPARLDRDFRLVFTPLNLPIIQGGPYFESEVAKVLEIGYREQIGQRLTYSLTAFRQNYEKLRSGMPAPAFIENRIEGFENGVEGWATLQISSSWRLNGGFSTLRQHLAVQPGSLDPTGPIALGSDPDYQWMLRSSHELGRGHEVDLILRRVASLPAQAPTPPVPAYTALDARWGFRVTRNVELSLTLRNLFDRRHAEFISDSEFERTAFFAVSLRL